MLWRHLCLVRAWSAAGLLTCSMLGGAALAEPEVPAPQVVTETVEVLEARKSGDLSLDVRGSGQDRVRMSLQNTSAKRLNVVLPPGLVASSTTGQAARGGFQSMGLGSVGNRPGSFGQFRASGAESGFQSAPVSGDPTANTVTVPEGQTVDLTIPAVCLNFGMPTPTDRDRFHLVDVKEYTPDPRIRKALRSLAETGTSQGVAQAVMWRVCNKISFESMVARASKIINVHEVALASRFIEALDAATGSDVVDPAQVTKSRVFLHVRGEGNLARDAERLAGEFDGLHLLGLPVRVVDPHELPALNAAPALFLNVTLTSGQTGETQGRLNVTHAAAPGQWTPLGKTSFTEGSSASVLDGRGLAKALDHAVAAAFVSVKPAKRVVGSTYLKIENRLPFTLANVVVKAGNSSGAPTVPFKRLGVGPGRSALTPIQAPGAVVERVELNGL